MLKESANRRNKSKQYNELLLLEVHRSNSDNNINMGIIRTLTKQQ
jgi:hypothetical protein